VVNYPIAKLPNLRILMLPRCRKSASPRRAERGYILITLILFVALIVIAAMVLVPTVAFQVKRDREEELIHRGVQYSRAMKHFVKKFGRYPTRIEELENTNQIRFLRRRYKDPITGKDFKILHMGDVQMALGAGVAGATPPNGLSPGGLSPGAPGAAGGPGALAAGPNGAMNTPGFAGGPATGATPGSQTTGPGTAPAPGSTPAAGQNSGENTSEENTADNEADATPNQSVSPAAAHPGAPGAFGGAAQGASAPGAQVFGGGPMVGVASTSKEKTIRVFNKKDHYYQWQFIYDPSSDRGGLLTTPTQGVTTLQPGAGTPGATGAPGASSPPATGVQGQPPGQGTQPGMEPPQMPPDQGP
jgi:type II secretory pathway pseudopilin PulG